MTPNLSIERKSYGLRSCQTLGLNKINPYKSMAIYTGMYHHQQMAKTKFEWDVEKDSSNQ